MHWPAAIAPRAGVDALPGERKAARTNVSHNASNRHGEDIIRVMRFLRAIGCRQLPRPFIECLP